jgi:hypothetical protein
MAEKGGNNVKLNFSIGNDSSPLSEVANVLDSFGRVLMWIFFIFVAYIVHKCIKKKNANSGKEKHS